MYDAGIRRNEVLQPTLVRISAAEKERRIGISSFLYLKSCGFDFISFPLRATAYSCFEKLLQTFTVSLFSYTVMNV